MSHITHKVGDKEYCIVQVPSASWNHRMPPMYKGHNAISYRMPFQPTRYIELPLGDYEILFVAEQEYARLSNSKGGEVEKSFEIVDIIRTIRANFPNHADFNHIVLSKNEKI